MEFIENKTFDEIEVGQSAELKRVLRTEEIELFAAASGDVNPTHLDEEFARENHLESVAGHRMWAGALISAVLGTELPGPGTVYRGQSFRFHRPIYVGDALTARVEVTSKNPKDRCVTLACRVVNQSGELVVDGEAEAQAPAQKARRPRAILAAQEVRERGARFGAILSQSRGAAPVRTAVVHPCDALSLSGAVEAAKDEVIEPILVGPRGKIEAAAEEAGLDIAPYELIEAEHSHDSAEKAVALVREARAEALMKGKLHTDELMAAVVDKSHGIRTDRRMSHVFTLDAPHYPKPLFITDAAINIYPDLDAKRDILQNAIDFVRAITGETPKVALLSAVETVTPKIASTVESAALCKMADRGQITGGILDGPLAFDNAVSKAAAATKGIASPVAGEADILLAPDLEAGNMIAKQLIYLAGAEAAGIVLGARAPIILTSRADSTLSRLASAAVAQLFIEKRRAR